LQRRTGRKQEQDKGVWGDEYKSYFGDDVSKARSFGKWLGARFKERKNIWWSVSGEYDAINGHRADRLTNADLALFDAMAEGLEEGHGGLQLMGIHPGGVRSSVPQFRKAENMRKWMDFNMLQSGHQFLSTGSGSLGEGHALIDLACISHTPGMGCDRVLRRLHCTPAKRAAFTWRSSPELRRSERRRGAALESYAIIAACRRSVRNAG